MEHKRLLRKGASNCIYLQHAHGERRCRTCARERTARVIAAETPEQKARRLEQCLAHYYANYADKRAAQNAYAATHRGEKRAYDRAYRPIKNARRRVTKTAAAP